MERFEGVLQSVGIVREMHARWFAEFDEDPCRLMWFGDGSGYGDPDYFRERLRESADISRAGLFLMLFARFEAEINQRCEALVSHHKAQPDWRDRRAWEAYDAGRIRDIPFKRRLALLIDRGRPIYAAVGNLYLERNEIAHGMKPILDSDMNKVIATLEAAVAAMEENS